jgi:hypothetical protein
MEMPTRCDLCDFWRVCKNVADFGKARYFEEPRELTVGMKGCKIVCQLPEGHGRLVDMNDVEGMFEAAQIISDDDCNCGYVTDDLRLEELPTIVPADTAERSET